MGKTVSGQPLGFLLLDKPKGVTSFYLVRALRKVFNVKRIGYAGTLDPLATGLMIVAVGEATKLLNALEQTDKVYDVKIRMGATSETYDAEGPVHAYENAIIPQRVDVEKVIQQYFVGDQMQVPPRYSAVKIAGKHAYDLVRKGKEVTIPARKVHFYDVKVRSYEYPFLECSVHCSPGTYIRTLAHDLGQKLGCGAYVEELRRTSIGKHLVGDAMNLDTLTRENARGFLVSPEKFLSDWQQIDVTDRECRLLRSGGFAQNRWGMKSGPSLALYERETIGLVELCEDGRSVKFLRRFNLE